MSAADSSAVWALCQLTSFTFVFLFLHIFSYFIADGKMQYADQGPCCWLLIVQDYVIINFIFHILSLYISLLCPHTARLCYVFHYPANVLVTVSLICESTRGKKQVRGRERTRANISKDKRKENYHQALQASLSLFPSPQWTPFFFSVFFLPPVDKMLINVKLSSLSFPALNALMRIRLPSRLRAVFWPPTIMGRGAEGVQLISGIQGWRVKLGFI